jgi:hypothetical protein
MLKTARWAGALRQAKAEKRTRPQRTAQGLDEGNVELLRRGSWKMIPGRASPERILSAGVLRV